MIFGLGVTEVVGVSLGGSGLDQAKESNASKSWRVGAGMISLVIIIGVSSAAKEFVQVREAII